MRGKQKAFGEEGGKMKTTKDKYVVLGSDLAGYPLKCAVAEHLEKEVIK